MNLKKTLLSKHNKSLLTTINTGYSKLIHNETPVPPIEFIDSHDESLMDTIKTGFDKENQVLINPPEPKYFVRLYKENYLSEFDSESDKSKARQNLGVYGKNEVSKIVSDVINDSTLSFITRAEIEEILQDLEVVSSKPKSYVNYEIPDKLFKL